MIAMKLGLLLSPFPLVAVLLLPGGERPIIGAESVEERACGARNARVGHEAVRVPWTRFRVLRGDVYVLYCVLHGDDDAPLDFARDAERVRFSLVGRGENVRTQEVGFLVTTSWGRTLTVGPASVRIEPRSQRSCRVDICTVFTDPGERVISVDVADSR